MITFKKISLLFLLFFLSKFCFCQQSPFSVITMKYPDKVFREIEISLNFSQLFLDGGNFSVYIKDRMGIKDTLFYNFFVKYSKDSVWLYSVEDSNGKFINRDSANASIKSKKIKLRIDLVSIKPSEITKVDCRYVDINNGPSKIFSIKPKEIIISQK
jgi:hypothetical protein